MDPAAQVAQVRMHTGGCLTTTADPSPTATLIRRGRGTGIVIREYLNRGAHHHGFPSHVLRYVRTTTLPAGITHQLHSCGSTSLVRVIVSFLSSSG